MLRIAISDNQESDLRAIAAAGPAALAAARALLDQPTTGFTSPKALRELLEGSLGEAAGQGLSRQLFGLISLARNTSSEIAEVVDVVRESLKATKKWQSKEMEMWDATVPELVKLLAHERVHVTAKALELAFNFNKIFTNAEILVDLRPVFDTTRDEIKGMLISHKLRLFLHTDTGLETHTIAMDEKDVKSLHRSCTDALKKADKAKAFITSSCHVDTFIVGKDFYE